VRNRFYSLIVLLVLVIAGARLAVAVDQADDRSKDTGKKGNAPSQKKREPAAKPPPVQATKVQPAPPAKSQPAPQAKSQSPAATKGPSPGKANHPAIEILTRGRIFRPITPCQMPTPKMPTPISSNLGASGLPRRLRFGIRLDYSRAICWVGIGRYSNHLWISPVIPPTKSVASSQPSRICAHRNA